MIESAVLHTPSETACERAAITRFMRRQGFATYGELWAWSVEDLEGFWGAVWDFFGVRAHRPYERVLADGRMPGARWFPGAELNYAEHAVTGLRGPNAVTGLRGPKGPEGLHAESEELAVVFRSEGRVPEDISFADLRNRVAAAADGLRRLGVGRGDRVVAYAPNIPETLVAFLATAGLGAVWSCCSPDFGVRAVIDRFRQIRPKVLIAADGYRFKGQDFDRTAEVVEIAGSLPGLEAVVVVPNLAVPDGLDLAGLAVPGPRSWAELTSGSVRDLEFAPVPFDHPLWVLYSSGTTGVPKALVHGHGGILLEHLKSLSLHMGLGPGDRFFWYTSTGWMMWNLLISGLLVGATVVLYDGSPAHPDLSVLWRLAEQTEMTYFGASAPYLQACMKAGVVPRRVADLSRLRALGSTGAPLPAEGFRWVYEHVNSELSLGSVSGGTDVCTAFVGSCPVLPVHAGEIQCRCLGADVHAFDPDGRSVVGQVGELVIRQPMPSMPLRLWGDDDGRRYRASYFETFPGVWRHGDWIRITERDTCVIYGRSDATLNRGGVRIGTSELYEVVEELPEVLDSLVVDTSGLGRDGRLYLFVVLAEGATLPGRIETTLRERLRAHLSPRHVPDEIVAVGEVPRTLNGKKMEVPVKRLLSGEPWEQVASPDAMANPGAMEPFVELARRGR